MVLLSEKSWEVSKSVIQAIKNHPFNKELADGTLALNKFSYYIEQDTLYLKEFARGLAMIASRVPLEYTQAFLRYSNDAFIAEQEIVHNFFRKTFDFKETGRIMPATISYTSYLLQICATQPVEVAIAAVLPCFWIYKEVGLDILAKADSDNPYIRWIETYSGEDFIRSVEEVIEIFNTLSSKATEEIQTKSIQAFYKSAVFEWHFWNDAYYENTFDGFLNSQN